MVFSMKCSAIKCTVKVQSSKPARMGVGYGEVSRLNSAATTKEDLLSHGPLWWLPRQSLGREQKEEPCFSIFAALGGNTLHRHGGAEVLFCSFPSKPSPAPTHSSLQPEGCGWWDWRNHPTSDFLSLKSGFNCLVTGTQENSRHFWNESGAGRQELCCGMPGGCGRGLGWQRQERERSRRGQGVACRGGQQEKPEQPPLARPLPTAPQRSFWVL